MHEPPDLLGAARRLAGRLRQNAPLSLRLAKQSLAATWTDTLEQAMQREVDGVLACLASEDLVEGTRAFLERRPPVYTGR